MLPGVTPQVTVRAGEAFNCILQNGGGYGDPILRDPEQVAADVAGRAVTADVAERVYGVVLRDGEVDVAGTEARRIEIRADRRARMAQPLESPGNKPSDGQQADRRRWGESLLLCSNGDGTLVAWCAHCDALLGEVGSGGWERLVARVVLDERDLGPLVKVAASLNVVQWVCPTCVTALWTDVVPVEGKTWQDLQLVGGLR